jgi:hypothetical protein
MSIFLFGIFTEKDFTIFLSDILGHKLMAWKELFCEEFHDLKKYWGKGGGGNYVNG